MSELMLKGFNPAKTYLDFGIDLILENGKTIQVKTSRGGVHKSAGRKPFFQYNFSCQDFKNNKCIKADFVVCWGIDDNLFLIIPKQEINTSLIQHGPKWNKSKWSRY